MKKLFLLFCLSLILNSCATIFNGRTTRVKIYAPENTKVQHNKQTSIVYDGKTSIYPKRSKDSLKFTLVNDSISTDFAFKRRVSGLIYCNIFVPITPISPIVGVLTDFTNQKRFTYKRNIFVEIDSTTNSFREFKGQINPFKQHTTFIYTSPLQLIDATSQPMVSLGGEYFPLDNLSLSAEYGIAYLNYSDDTKFGKMRRKGHSTRFELKYYNLLKITSNPKINEYLGLEARFIRQQFNKKINYTRTNEEISYPLNERVLVHKFVNVFNIKYGLNFPVGKRMYLDLYTGFGFRNKWFKNPNSQFNPETDKEYSERGHFWSISDNNYLEGKHDRELFNFSLGFKFGIKL